MQVFFLIFFVLNKKGGTNMNKIPIINQIIKDKRKKLKLTQNNFAEIINKSPTTVKRYDTGDIIPQNTLLLICDKLGLDLIDLFIEQQTENQTTNSSFYSDLILKYIQAKQIYQELNKNELLRGWLFDILLPYYTRQEKELKDFRVEYFDNRYYIKGSNDETLDIFSESQATELVNHFKDYIDYFIFKCQKENLNK